MSSGARRLLGTLGGMTPTTKLTGTQLWGLSMLLVSVAIGLMTAFDLAAYALSGDISYVSGKYRIAATGNVAVVMNVAMLIVSVLLGIIGWRYMRRG